MRSLLVHMATLSADQRRGGRLGVRTFARSKCTEGSDSARDLQPVRNLRSLAVAAIDAPLPFLLSFQLFEGEKSFESPVVHLAAGGNLRINPKG